MKKSLFIILTAAVFSMAACDKTEIQESESPQDVKVNISVADLEPGTRAIKTGWTAGDKINIWFDDVSTQIPHLIISYNGTTWVPGSIDSDARAALKTDGTGTFKYVYEAGNDISAYAFSFGYMYDFPYGQIGGKNYYAPVLTVGSPDTNPNYDYDGSVLNLDLNVWWYITNAQVVVTGLSGEPTDWYLTVSTNNYTWYSIQDFRNDPEEPGWGFGISGYSSRGTNNTDGVAFYFRIPDSSLYNETSNSSSAGHTFTLYSATNKYTYFKGWTPITSAFAAENPDASYLEKLGRTFTAIKIPFSKFEQTTN